MATKADLKKFIKKGKQRRIANIVVNIVCAPLIFLVCCMAVSLLISASFRTTPSFFNRSFVVISSGSMEASGFKVKSVAAIKKTNAKNLKVGDIIAYYRYDLMQISDCTNMQEVEEFVQQKDKITFANMIGYPTEKEKEAGGVGSIVIFHQIVKIKQDEDGNRYFQTKGSSNPSADAYYVKEDYILGKYESSGGILKLVSIMYQKNLQVLVVLIPVLVVSFVIAYNLIVSLNIAFLEKDIVDGKRRLDDKVCVEANVGYGMSNKTKYLVLKNANPKDRIYFIPLLWRNAERPTSIQRYYYKQDLLMKKYEKLDILKAECNERVKYGESKTKVMRYYYRQKDRINAEIDELNEKISLINKRSHLRAQNDLNVSAKRKRKPSKSKSNFWH